MRKFVKVLALALSLALSLLFADAALADSRVRTLQDIKDSGTLVIGVFSDKKPFGYVDENGDNKKEDTGLYISYSRNDDTKTWIINSSSGEDYNFDTKYTSETDIFETNVKNGDVYISFATAYTASEKTAAYYVSVKYNVSLDYAKKEIVSTEYISSGAGGGYGDVLLSKNGGDASKYSMADATKAVEFYNNYIKIDSPKKFEEFTKVSYDTFRDINDYKDEDFVIHVGATYTAIGYMTVMQRVIEYANAEHTLGKVKA